MSEADASEPFAWHTSRVVITEILPLSEIFKANDTGVNIDSDKATITIIAFKRILFYSINLAACQLEFLSLDYLSMYI
jgi:hypothetical protein